MRLDEILEHWAEIYTPISHDPIPGSDHKAYYRIKTINMENELMRNHNRASSPCLCYSVIVDAEARSTKQVSYQHTLYFMSRAKARALTKEAKNNEDLGIDQQLFMDEMARDLLSYLQYLKANGKDPITEEKYDPHTINTLRGLNLDSVHWASLPLVVKYGEWHVLGMQIEQLIPLSPCFNPQKYKTKN